MSKKTALPDFEAALAELEKIVKKMESGDQSLEDALAAFHTPSMSKMTARAGCARGISGLLPSRR